ncbi:MAG: hypothetical protein IT304_09250 [Dehalococcoidia bacterium]|nr:hypothetical protein [Dehalococcoidia bacterium]
MRLERLRRQLTPTQQRALVWGLSLLAALLVGVLVTGGCQGAGYTVVRREGSPLPLPAGEALVVLPGYLLENVVAHGVVTANTPVDISDVKVHYTPEGIAISAKAHVGLKVFSVPVPFSTVVHPTASDSGGIAVHLSDTRAVGGRLPLLFEQTLESAVNNAIENATAIKDYRIVGVEETPQGLYVYVEYTGLGPVPPLSLSGPP